LREILYQSVAKALTAHAEFVEYFVDTDADQYIVLPEGSGLPWTVWVGAAGMPGQTAFYSWKVRRGSSLITIF
jgi:hypothetical protein